MHTYNMAHIHQAAVARMIAGVFDMSLMGDLATWNCMCMSMLNSIDNIH